MPTGESLKQLEPASRMAILLEAADAASRLKLDRHPETLDACMNALNLCRTWMAGAVWERHMLIVFQYDLGAIKTEIERYLGSCVGDDWHSLAMKVSRVASWEFEEYQP
ncbi:Imm8 family immunity protein [Herbaspirillum huttiense]|uniref:Imm8 family immunity protein n=1 Tax=Herbaspirillum huttiense TaxID=863372 RepID=UPI0031DC1531